MREKCQIILDGEEFTVSNIVITCSQLNKIIGKKGFTKAWVGRKYDGIYIGFRKAEMEKLEKLAFKKFGIKPLRKLEEPPSRIKDQNPSNNCGDYLNV